jgi:hypothetical protein
MLLSTLRSLLGLFENNSNLVFSHGIAGYPTTTGRSEAISAHRRRAIAEEAPR